MLTEPLDGIRRRARRLLQRLPVPARQALGALVVETRSQVGGGALPTVELPTAALALGSPSHPSRALDEALRTGRPAVLGRLADDRLLLDCRTVQADELPAVAARLAALA